MDILTEFYPARCTEREKVHRIRTLIVEIQAEWFYHLYDTGMVFADPDVWAKMQEAICLLRRRDNPSAVGMDLDEIAGDYDLLEQIFIGKHWLADDNGMLDGDTFAACALVELQHFSKIKVLQEANALAAKLKEQREGINNGKK